MVAVIALLVLAQGGPGPIETFRTNYANIKVDVQYIYRAGWIEASAVANGRLWSQPDLGFVEDREATVHGQWACDGRAEYYAFSSLPDVREAMKSDPPVPVGEPDQSGMSKMHRKLGVPKTEAIFDGQTLAGRQDAEMSGAKNDAITVWTDGDPGYLTLGKGPFFGLNYPFPQILRFHFPDTVPARRHTLRGGYSTVVEIYKKMQSPVDWHQIEVSYDPVIGYLPRYLRSVSFNAATKTFVTESYLVSARPCSAGGFVPTEWYTVRFAIDDFGSKYPNYDDDAILSPPTRRVQLGHFKVTDLKDRSRPVAFSQASGIRAIGSAGGSVVVHKGGGELTLDAIKSRMGKKLTTVSRPTIPTLDISELREFSPRPASKWPQYALAIVLGIGGLFVIARKKD